MLHHIEPEKLGEAAMTLTGTHLSIASHFDYAWACAPLCMLKRMWGRPLAIALCTQGSFKVFSPPAPETKRPIPSIEPHYRATHRLVAILTPNMPGTSPSTS